MLNSGSSASATKGICIIKTKTHLALIFLIFEGIIWSALRTLIRLEGCLISWLFEKRIIALGTKVMSCSCHVFVKYQDALWYIPLLV